MQGATFSSIIFGLYNEGCCVKDDRNNGNIDVLILLLVTTPSILVACIPSEVGGIISG